jgi:Putative peptidoglycan binding domain
MEGREQRDPGYDDWFDEPEPPSESRGSAGRSAYDDVEEVWVLPEEEARPRVRRPRRREIVVAGRSLATAQAIVIVASLLAVVIGALAAVGVFNGSKAALPPVTPPTTTTPPASTSTPTNTTPATEAPSAPLKPGDTGSQVKVLQRALAALGFSPGKPDGDFGPATQNAVEKFQRAKGLTADGIVGPQTLAKLKLALSG